MNKAPIFYRGVEEHARKLAQSINEMIDGSGNATGSFTATANTAITTVINERASDSSHIDFSPLTANAAAEVATIYVSTRANGSFTVTHASNAQTDRTFTYSIQKS